MAKSDRLFRLMQLMRTLPQPVRAATLAERLEVSRRTLYRDIEALRVAGARIEGEAGVGYTLVEDFAMPPQTLTRLETEALAIGLADVQFRGDAQLAAAARDAMAKITATLKEHQQRDVLHAVSQVYRFTTHEASTVDITAIREACWDERALRITYEDRKGAVTQRRIFPLAVLYFEYAVMLLAYCHLRDGYRSFHVTHIRDVQPLDERFRPHRVRLLNDYIVKLRARLGESGEDLTVM
ncbi:helix-turn-helix transcriptional regulator [Loktanella sp. Alg231-35]|uniref:helix-turn-helix transcriptional regulator n=1 Tax=Loktanella sp. Alg231-35 TaxID=1922220 RepID=UPI000D5544B3|nr:YafY family protein [Loktanella sp. Alg231-35]